MNTAYLIAVAAAAGLIIGALIAGEWHQHSKTKLADRLANTTEARRTAEHNYAEAWAFYLIAEQDRRSAVNGLLGEWLEHTAAQEQLAWWTARAEGMSAVLQAMGQDIVDDETSQLALSDRPADLPSLMDDLPEPDLDFTGQFRKLDPLAAAAMEAIDMHRLDFNPWGDSEYVEDAPSEKWATHVPQQRDGADQ